MSVLRIQNVYPGSEFFRPGSRIQGQKDSGSWIRIRIKEFKNFYPKKLFLSPRKYDPDPGTATLHNVPRGLYF
jgi:hypothetical protein